MFVELVIMGFKINFRVELPRAAEHEVLTIAEPPHSWLGIDPFHLPYRGPEPMTGQISVTVAPRITFGCEVLTIPCVLRNETSEKTRDLKSEEIQFWIHHLNNLFGLLTSRQIFIRQTASLTKQVIFSTQSLFKTEFSTFSPI